jgi:NADH-quinone oxidoreductase subunit J
VVQVIIYAGAIMVLFIFVIMMINLRTGVPADRKKWTLGLAAVLGFVLLGELVFAARGLLTAGTPEASDAAAGPEGVGRVLFTRYLYPFEITSILILAALVGAIVLAKKRDRT